MLASDLDYLLERVREEYDFAQFYNGDCDVLALAVFDFLTENGEKAGLCRITRETTIYHYDEDEDEDTVEEDSNDLSHAYVEWAGEDWDIDGMDAFERWNNDWVREENEETYFGIEDTNEAEILEIRKTKSEPFDQEFRLELLHFLRTKWAQMKENNELQLSSSTA